MALPHELRTPLTGILGFSEVLAQDGASLPPQEIQAINKSAKRLNSALSNFLLYAELEIAVRDPAYANMFLGDGECRARPVIARAAIKQARQAHREADLHVELQDAVIRMAAPYAQKIADELTSNAFKF